MNEKSIPTSGPNRKHRRTWAIVTSLVLLLVAAGVGIWASVHRTPPRPTDDPVAVLHYVATPQFASLTDEQKTPYVIAIRDNLPAILDHGKELTPEEQRSAYRNILRIRSRLEMKAYQDAPDAATKKKLLDRLIDEQEMVRKRVEKAVNKGAPSAEPTALALKQWVESLSPAERVELAGFAWDLMQRRVQRGLPMWPFASAPKE